ncbi:MAG: response regulator [Pedosphaera sp.]|nr:response regulator [Pedosphaera sp.]
MKPHLLFVDDEAPIREMLSLYFHKRGYEVSTATESAEAVRLAEGNTFSAAILDVDIAGENGLALLTLLKAKYPKLPIIMFTGFDTNEDLLAKAMSLGADGFMRKTESLHDLLGIVERYAPVD